jgi:hypothetical protein
MTFLLPLIVLTVLAFWLGRWAARMDRQDNRVQIIETREQMHALIEDMSRDDGFPLPRIWEASVLSILIRDHRQMMVDD